MPLEHAPYHNTTTAIAVEPILNMEDFSGHPSFVSFEGYNFNYTLAGKTIPEVKQSITELGNRLQRGC
jgi:hypothetical protein